MYQVERALKDVVDVALKRGFVSFHQVNDYLPDEGGDPQMVDRMILVMEELELGLADDPNAPPALNAAMQQQIDTIYAAQQKSEFGSQRNAILFLPGEYKLDIPIGFYTEIIGLGASPDGVRIAGNGTNFRLHLDCCDPDVIHDFPSSVRDTKSRSRRKDEIFLALSSLHRVDHLVG